jgi:uncharacterized protein YdhG (YjbR/CyaY superfamily)
MPLVHPSGSELDQRTNLGVMPMQKRADVADYYARLADDHLPYLEKLRELSRAAAPDLVETLHWNNPVYLKDGVRLWMLQAFKHHCSLRFPPRQFAEHRAEVEAAGYEAGEGFIKLPYDRPLPVDLLKRLLQYRLTDFEATGSGW